MLLLFIPETRQLQLPRSRVQDHGTFLEFGGVGGLVGCDSLLPLPALLRHSRQLIVALLVSVGREEAALGDRQWRGAPVSQVMVWARNVVVGSPILCMS